MMTRRIPREIALLLCALAACWPLTELTRSGGATVPAAASVCTMVAVGALCRLRPLPGPLTLLLQLGTLAITLVCVLVLRGITPDPVHVRRLITALQETVHSATTPLPGTPGVIVMIVFAAAVLALVIDYVAGTARMVMFAAVPILAPFLLSAAALGRVLPVRYFVAAAAAWALLAWIHVLQTRQRTRWNGSSALLFTVMSAVAIAGSLAITPHIPHRAAPALADGGTAGVDTSVNFSTSLDLRRSLHSTNSAPVLQYDTTATVPPPLRVVTSSSYDNDGVWKASRLDGPSTWVKGQTAVPIPGLSDATPTRTIQTSVTVNGLQGLLVAAPAPLRAANFGPENDRFHVLTDSGTPVLAAPSTAYAVLSRELAASARPSSTAQVSTDSASVTSDDVSTTMLAGRARELVDQLVTRSGNAATPFDQAVAIQRYLRQGGGFRYSLDAPKARENGADLDPLSAFLVTKQGYCTQFATTMIMAARSQGIPARMAIGFLPGKQQHGHYEVHASDAHAWPELYFPGLGWTRFDPTPPSRSGAAPSYAPDVASLAPRPSSRPTTRSSSATSTPTPTLSSSSTQSSTHSSSSTQPPTRQHHGLPAWLATTLWILAGLLLLAALLAVLPLAGRAERGRLLRRATDEGSRDEGHWHAMAWALADLGLPLRTNLSPRATLTHFRADHPRHSERLGEALERAVEAIETRRYAKVPTQSVGTATHRATTAAWDAATRTARLRALLLPSSGVEFFRRLVRPRRR